MRALILTAVTAVVLGLGLAPQTASAAWRYHTVHRYDSACHRYVDCTERIWEPEVVVSPPVVACTPAPVIVETAPIVIYRGYHDHYHR
jgi:hypothetical protein